MKKIALGVSSSISIYKSCEILRGFQKKGFQVQVIMTKNATQLVSPQLFSALSGSKAVVDPFKEDFAEKIAHVDLSKEISLFLVAPATANVIGKFASGVADDFLSTFYLTVQCPVLMAPAMNEAMYLHRITQENIQKLKSHGVRFVEPGKGYLACQDKGWGRLASSEKIVEEGLKLINRKLSLKGKTVLVTAGPTREFLDPVRFLTNRSSGKMGFDIAEEAFNRGAKVILISGPTNLLPPRGVACQNIQTAEEMEKAVTKSFNQADIVVMAAAVSDVKFAEKANHKIKKKALGEEVKLLKTQDILKDLGQKKNKKILVGFAAETERVVNNAFKKIKEKNLDLIVANNISRTDIGFESNFNQVSLIYPDGKAVHIEKKTKLEVSQIILDEIEGILGKRKG